MGQSQHKYAAVHLYSEGLEGCIDKVPSVAYLLPGSYCDNTDEFGVDQTKVVGGLFYDSKSEWWKDPPVSDFGWGKLPYQGTYLDDSSANDVCGALSFQCPEIALYSNQSICNYTTMCPPPSTSACADRTLGNSLNVAASSTAMLDAVQYYRIECEFDVRGSLLFRELDGDSCSDFDETFADTTGVPGVSDGQNYVGWWALPGVFGSSLGQANCVDASHEGTYWQRWVLSEQTQSSSEGDKVVQTVDVKFFLEEAECNAFDDQLDAVQGDKDFASRVVPTLESTPWEILFYHILHADVFSGSGCMRPLAGESICPYDSSSALSSQDDASNACKADVDCPGFVRVPPEAGADEDAVEVFYLCTSEPATTSGGTRTQAWKRTCRSPPWRTGCMQLDQNKSPYPIGMAAFLEADNSWVGWVWFAGVVGALLGAYFLWRAFCWKPCKKYYDDIVQEGSKRRVKPWTFVEAPLEPSERKQNALAERDDSDEGLDATSAAEPVAFCDMLPRAWEVDLTRRQRQRDVFLRKYCFRAGPIGIHFRPFVDLSDSARVAAVVAAVAAFSDNHGDDSVRSNGGPVGVQVARLEPGGRAEEAGVPVGALVVQLNGQDVTHYTVPELNSLLASLKVNQTGVFATLHVRIVDPASQTTSGTEDTYVSAAQQLKPNKTISPAMLEKVDAAGWIPAIDAAGRSCFVKLAIEPVDPEVDKRIEAAHSWYNPWIDDWHELRDDHGNPYYFNGLRQEASWEKPAAAQADEDESARILRDQSRMKLLRARLSALDGYANQEGGVYGFSAGELEVERAVLTEELSTLEASTKRFASTEPVDDSNPATPAHSQTLLGAELESGQLGS